MTYQRIAKSKMGRRAQKRGWPIVAHLSPTGKRAPLCQAPLSPKAKWLTETDEGYQPERECKNCALLAARDEARDLDAQLDVALARDGADDMRGLSPSLSAALARGRAVHRDVMVFLPSHSREF